MLRTCCLQVDPRAAVAAGVVGRCTKFLMGLLYRRLADGRKIWREGLETRLIWLRPPGIFMRRVVEMVGCLVPGLNTGRSCHGWVSEKSSWVAGTDAEQQLVRRQVHDHWASDRAVALSR